MLLIYKNIYHKILLHLNAGNTDARGLDLILTTPALARGSPKLFEEVICLTLSEKCLEAFKHLCALENRMSDACALPWYAIPSFFSLICSSRCFWASIHQRT